MRLYEAHRTSHLDASRLKDTGRSSKLFIIGWRGRTS